MSIMKARHDRLCCGNLVIWWRRASFLWRHRSHLQGNKQKIRTMGASLGVDSIRWRPIILLDNTLKRHGSKLQGDEKKIRALGSSTIGWRPVVIVKNTSRWHTCRHHLGVASRNGERAKNLISLVKIYGKYYPDKKQITSIIIKIIFNLTSRLNCKHTLHYQGCRKKKYKFYGNKVANTSFNICYHLTKRRSNPATTTASCNTLNNAKCQDNNCNSPSWSTRVYTKNHNKNYNAVANTNCNTTET